MKDMVAIKWLVENTGLYFYVKNKNKAYVTDWGKVTHIASNGLVYFSRYDHRKATGGYKDALMDCLTPTTMEFHECQFHLFTNLGNGWRDEYNAAKTYHELVEMIIRRRSISFKFKSLFKFLKR
jgi:hypothetical protein